MIIIKFYLSKGNSIIYNDIQNKNVRIHFPQGRGFLDKDN